jgi:hypothetical protein
MRDRTSYLVPEVESFLIANHPFLSRVHRNGFRWVIAALSASPGPLR